MEIYTSTKARQNFSKIIQYVNSSHEPVYVVSPKGKVVILDEEDYRSLAETLYLTSIPGMVESILEADAEPLENCTETLDWGEDDGQTV